MSLAEDISDRDLWNPYDFANPVDDQDVFAGRTDELKDIKYYLRLASKAARPINLVLTGPRSSGKTSLLNRIEFESLQRKFCVARIDLNESDADRFTLFYKIYDAILFAAVTDGAFNGVDGETYSSYRATVDGGGEPGDGQGPLLFPRHLAAATARQSGLSEPTLKSDLRTISAEVGKPIVLLFDECDVLGKSRVELEMLRNVFMNTAGYMLVFAGTPNLFPVMEDVFSPIVRQFKKIQVERFNDLADTTACIENPLRKIDVDPKKVLKPDQHWLAVEIDQLSGGRPYEIQLLCHFMFKRVEEGDARNMSITLDVLDDVRAELENQDKGNDRPSVAALHRLSSRDFVDLQALTEFQGTIDQYAARSILFTEDPYDPAALESSFSRFEAMNLLARDASGVISFKGDQFDEVYSRYYAAANETRLFIWPGSFEAEASELLFDRLSDTADVEQVFLAPSGLEEARRRLNEALTLLIGEEEPESTSISDSGTPLYDPILRSYDRGSLTLISARLSVVGSEITVWAALTDGSIEEFLATPQLVTLTERAEALGGTLDVEIFEKPLPPLEELVRRVEDIASPNQLEVFSEDHNRFAFITHHRGDYAVAAMHFGYAHRLHPDPSLATAVAHCRLMEGQWKSAEAAAFAARDLAGRSDDDGMPNLKQYTFATYDLAVATAGLGDLETALEFLDEAEATHDAQDAQDAENGYFAVPVSFGHNFSVELLSEKPVSEAIKLFRVRLEESHG